MAEKIGKRSPNASKLEFGDLKGRVAIISGSSRGIGREVALALAREGCHIVVAAKSTESTPTLPGSIYTVADEVKNLGADALPFKLDVLDDNSIVNCVAAAWEKFGRIDICVNNASALWWQPIAGTPVKKYDLITRLNSRGSFLLTKECLQYMIKPKPDGSGSYGRVISMSPPITVDYESYRGLTAYNMSKYGMTMVAFGAAAEYADQNVTGNALWPATIIESQASINFSLGDKKLWRKATILADATVALCCDPKKPTGQAWIDDEYLKHRGLTDHDLIHYRYDETFDPPRLLAKNQAGIGIHRGNVRKVDQDKKDMDESSDIKGINQNMSKL